MSNLVENFSDAKRFGDASQDFLLWSNDATGKSFQNVFLMSFEHVMNPLYFGTLQNPALMDAPISLEMEVTSAPKSTIKTSGATAAVHAGVRVLVLPPGKSPVLLSSMTMV